MTAPPNADPMGFLKSIWGQFSTPLPGFVTPMVDADELGKRITDMKAVEGWLKSNLEMLQMSIQALEVQRATLATLEQVAKTSAETGQSMNGDANTWPWNILHAAATAASGTPQGSIGPRKAAKSARNAAPRSRSKKAAG